MNEKKIAITGASGFIGSALRKLLKKEGHEVWDLVRRMPIAGAREILWNYQSKFIERDKLEGFDAVIHLAGESIAAGRWNPKRKAAIRDSRIEGTRFLAEALAGLAKPPKLFLSASAIGFYGDRGNEELTEQSPRGSGFLPETCEAWEKAADSLKKVGSRVAHIRTGIVLNKAGGALPQMTRPFFLGLGGIIGSGDQWMSWITLEDLIAVYHFILGREDLAGPFNAAAPGAAPNRDFTKILGRVLKRPTLFPLPAFMVKILLGEMGEKLLLEGQKVRPIRLTEAGFKFLYPDLEPALRSEMGLIS